MILNVKQLSGPEGVVQVSAGDSVEQVKEQLQSKWNIPVNQQRLVLKGKTLEDDKLLSDYCVEDGQKLFLSVRKDVQDSNAARHPTTAGKVGEPQAHHGMEEGRHLDFWGELFTVLRRHFREEDAIRLLQQYRADYKASIARLSLDQIERVASAGQQRLARTATQYT